MAEWTPLDVHACCINRKGNGIAVDQCKLGRWKSCLEKKESERADMKIVLNKWHIVDHINKDETMFDSLN